MDCILEKIGPSPKGANLDLWRCVRRNCGRESHFLNGIERAFGAPDCNGLPLNASEIVAMFSEAWGLDRAAAIVRYIRWRAKGSPLDELPPGVPSPHIAPTPLTASELSELFPGEDPTLLGNRIKALTDALGIPACGGCERRRRWINDAHAWLRGS
jgi:hypothetical protein